MTDSRQGPANEVVRQAGDGYVLHSYPYKETSLLVDAFTRTNGRITLVARSARRPRSAMRGTLMAFQPLSLSWYGRGEVKTLTKAEWLGGMGLLRGEALLCAFYVNELLIRLLAREDAHEALFDRYSEALRQFAAGEASAPILRRFEKALLKELGYALVLDREAHTGEEIDPAGYYTYHPEKGPLAARGGDAEQAVMGRTLLSLARDEFDDLKTMQEARGLMRSLINHRLEERQLNSRKVFRELLEL